VEQDRRLVSALEQQLGRLGAEGLAEIHHAEALSWLADTAISTYDIVFLDPPFAGQLAQKSCALLVEKGYLNRNARVYIESEPGLTIKNAALQQLRQKMAGQVQYQLLEYHRKL